MTMVRLRTDDGRVFTAPRATGAETWEAVIRAYLRGADVAGVWQGVRAEDGAVILVPASAVVEPLRAVTR